MCHNTLLIYQKLLKKLSLLEKGKFPVYCDKNAAMSTAQNSVQHDRTKHAEIDKDTSSKNKLRVVSGVCSYVIRKAASCCIYQRAQQTNFSYTGLQVRDEQHHCTNLRGVLIDICSLIIEIEWYCIKCNLRTHCISTHSHGLSIHQEIQRSFLFSLKSSPI